MTRIPVDAAAPIACTATATELPVRIEAVERLRAGLRSVERTSTGLLLRFPADPALEPELRRFVVDEKGCCRFWGFDLDVAPDGITLRWDGPASAAGILDELHAAFTSDAPLTDLAGLL